MSAYSTEYYHSFKSKDNCDKYEQFQDCYFYVLLRAKLHKVLIQMNLLGTLFRRILR